MAALVDGQRYGLSSQGQNSENRTLIFVKLTDSALRAIDEFLNLRGSTTRQPTIQFQGNHGVIKFPSSQNEHSFDFNCVPSSGPGVLGESVECLKKNTPRKIDSLGCMQFKMHIQAKDDIYQTTRVRMAAAEEESKKNCTKVIKAAGPYVGRKVKVKKGLSAIPPRPISTSPPYSSTNTSSVLPFSKSSSSSLVNKPNLTNGHHHVNGSGSNFQSNGCSNGSNNKSVSNTKVAGNPDIMKKSYRDRVIHLLALRSYKKPELLARLMKEGIKEKDKKCLTSLLGQVATMKDNSYQLAKHIWSEIQEDWPFYNDHDRELLKRRMPANLTPPTDGNSSPANISSSPPPPPVLLKRQATSNFNSNHSNSNGAIPPSKKQRISHYVRQTETKPSPQLHTNNNNNSNKIDGSMTNGHVQEMSDNSVVKMESTLSKMDSTGFLTSYGMAKENKNNGYGGVANVANSTGRCSGQLTTSSSVLCNGSTGGSHQSTPSSSPDSHDNVDSRGSSSQHSNDSSTISLVTDLHDYLKKYPVITSAEQRAMYKSDFNAEYEEYRQLHSTIERVSKRFAVLEEQLRNSEEGTDDSRRIKEEILREYKENKRNEKYQTAKVRFNYLHQKLSHIKKLVIGYDNTYMCES